jgi:hypothetical protein
MVWYRATRMRGEPRLAPGLTCLAVSALRFDRTLGRRKLRSLLPQSSVRLGTVGLLISFLYSHIRRKVTTIALGTNCHFVTPLSSTTYLGDGVECVRPNSALSARAPSLCTPVGSQTTRPSPRIPRYNSILGHMD